MKQILAALLLTSTLAPGCRAVSNMFREKTPHEQYEKALDKTDLEETPAGRAWLAASRQALEHPQSISLPYRHEGFFGADKARAVGLKFTANKGERLTFSLPQRVSNPFALYADLFREGAASGDAPLASADTLTRQFHYDVETSGTYVLRVQPELFRTGSYGLSVSVGPSLTFPVSGNKGKAGSFWGASRDGGQRRHEGIDIFAPKLTPVVAAADGVITGVREGGIGGKVVWLRVAGKDITLYYAHLHQQLVQEGQQVLKGDTLGLVGNTGNAKNTASHLHFGIYTAAGPIDPWRFINPAVKTAAAPPQKNLANYVRLTKTMASTPEGPLRAGTLLVPVAVSTGGYLAELPGGRLLTVPFAMAQTGSPVVKGVESLATKSSVGKSAY